MKRVRQIRRGPVAACAVLAVGTGRLRVAVGAALAAVRPPAAAWRGQRAGRSSTNGAAIVTAPPQGPGSMALQRKYQGAVPAVLEQRSDLTPDT